MPSGSGAPTLGGERVRHVARSNRSETTQARKRPRHPSLGTLGFLEILVLGTLAAVLTLWAIPSAIGIEWECLAGSGGVEPGRGDSYLSGVVVLGTVGWLLVSIGVLYAQIFESRRGTLLLPVAWFVAFVLGTLIVALTLGSQHCPA
jgi:hypothetical protein